MRLIVRAPSPAFRHALSRHGERERIDPAHALEEHRDFCRALRAAGATLAELPPEPELADAPFVSDMLVALPEAGSAEGPAAVLVATYPGAPSRRAEAAAVINLARSLADPATPIVRILEPGTLEGGDVLVFGDRLAIGISGRTNRCGAAQLAAVGATLGYRVALCPVTDRLHLATAVTAVRASRLIGTRAGFASLEAAEVVSSGPELPGAFLADVERITLPDADLAAANVLAVAGVCVMAAGHPGAAAALRARGERVVELALDEFERADGGPTCLVAPVP